MKDLTRICSIDFSLCLFQQKAQTFTSKKAQTKVYATAKKAQTKVYATAIFLLLFSFTSFAQNFTISGKITSKDSGEPLVGVTVMIKGRNEGTQTDIEGVYKLALAKGNHTLVFSFVGFKTIETLIDINDNANLNAVLEIYGNITYCFGTVEVIGQRTPFTQTTVSKTELQKQNLGQDLPILLNFTPSIVTTSDAGAGVGYTGMRIRGSDATRTNVTINGIPVNDAESQGVFWVNMPDFASSVNSVQIQRGVGTSVNGAGAFGATVNLETSKPSDVAYAEISNTYGSFNTWKNNVQFGTGLIKNKFKIDARLSRIASDGFIDRAKSDLKSFYVSGEYQAGKAGTFTTNIFSGKEITYQAWEGVPEAILKQGNRTYNVYNYDNQVDNYQQDHYQFLHKINLGGSFTLNSALHYTKGQGYYEQFKAGEKFADYNLPDVVVGNETIKKTDLIRRRWLDNDFYGMVANLTYRRNRIEAVLGGGYNVYQGKHFGEIIWAKYASTGNIRQRYYDNNATKKDFNAYTKINYNLFDDFWAFADMQIRTVSYDFLGFDNDKRNVTQAANLTFFNPKFGVRYGYEKHDFYASYSVGNREPNRTDYTESTPNSRPKHETLHNLEAGYTLNTGKFLFSANYYLMSYTNQLVVTGKLNDVGAAVRQNTPNSYRTGIELQANYLISNKLKWNINATFSQNKIANYREYLNNYNLGEQDSLSYSDVDIAFSPSMVAGSQFTFSPTKWFNVALLTKYVGQQYLDNTQNESRKLNAYFTNDLRFNFVIKPKFMRELNVSFLANNILNTLYESNGYTFGYIVKDEILNKEVTIRENFYYPQAGANFLGQVILKF
jgi:iron complex outermembrane receptor protein